MQVKAGSKCDIAGIKVGEIILAINGVSATNQTDFDALIKNTGHALKLELSRWVGLLWVAC